MTDIAEIKRLYSKMVADINLDDGKQKAFATRIKRAISWYDRAENEIKDADAKVIFFWIAFNALYGEDKFEEREAKRQNKFLKQIVKLDSNQIHTTIKEDCPEEYINLMSNRYICWQYWGEIRNRLSNSGIKRKQEKDLENSMDKRWDSIDAGDETSAKAFLAENECTEKRTSQNLCALFERIYELRNQIVHGNASWSADVNRSQVENGCAVLESLIPLFIHLMLTKTKDVKAASKLFGGKVHRPPYRFWNKKGYFDLNSP